jgi:hypothetical protein
MAAEQMLTAIVFAGGLGLGAHRGGAVEALTSFGQYVGGCPARTG